MKWIGYKKAYNSVSYDWIEKNLKTYKVRTQIPRAMQWRRIFSNKLCKN